MRYILFGLFLSSCTIFDPPSFEIRRTEDFQVEQSAPVQSSSSSVGRSVELREPTPFKTGRQVNPPPACREAREHGNPC